MWPHCYFCDVAGSQCGEENLSSVAKSTKEFWEVHNLSVFHSMEDEGGGPGVGAEVSIWFYHNLVVGQVVQQPVVNKQQTIE